MRTLFAAGKLNNLMQEMERMRVSILGVSEVRWPNSGVTRSKDKVFYYSGTDDADRNHRHGVGILIEGSLQKSVKDFVPISERVALLRLCGGPIDINIIQVYAPTSEKPDNEVEQFYGQIEQAIKLTKSNEINIILGDLNAKVGKGKVEGIVGDWGIGERNDRGGRLVQFCDENNLVITNTWYKLPPRRLYTWKSPQDNEQQVVRNQIDFIMINRRFRNTITRVVALPGADIESDHNPLCANIRLRLAKAKRKRNNKRFDARLLRNSEIRSEYDQHLNRQLSDINATDDVEECWTSIKNAFENANNTHLLKKNTLIRNEWMNTEILELMERRRQCKIHNDAIGYRHYQRRTRNEIRIAKEKWLADRCMEAEHLTRIGDSFHLHKKVKEIAGLYKKTPITHIRDEEDEIILEPKKLLETWKTYATNLFNDQRSQDPPLPDNNLPYGPYILESEVLNAIKLSKSDKAPGPDNMLSETFHLISDQNITIITRLFNHIYDTGNIPADWLRSTFITIPKSNNTQRCKDYRLISLMSHFLKLLLRIIHTRLYRRCEEVSGFSQFGFKKGFGTREAIFSLQTLVQNCLDQRKNAFICFIDYEKAFDNVRHELMVTYLQELGLDDKDVRMIANLYWHQTAQIRLQNSATTEEFEIRKGVRQGCILSPMLFNLYVERAFAEITSERPMGIIVNGTPINNIRYADDTAIIADNANDLQTLLNTVNEASQQRGLKINTGKTKFMVISRDILPNVDLQLNGEQIERVNKFKYLGSVVNDQWNPELEIRCRIEQARATFLKLKKFLTNRNLNFKLRYRMVKCYVWSVLLYGAEAWTLKAASINRIEAFEMWILKRMLKIPWTEHVRNEDVLRIAGLENRELFEHIKKRKISYLGHIIRGERYDFQRLILQGKIKGGRRGIGRKKLSWLRNIRQWTGISDFQSLQEAAVNRVI